MSKKIIVNAIAVVALIGVIAHVAFASGVMNMYDGRISAVDGISFTHGTNTYTEVDSRFTSLGNVLFTSGTNLYFKDVNGAFHLVPTTPTTDPDYQI